MEAADVAPWLQCLVNDGIIAGVGAVIGFIPQMVILFLLLGHPGAAAATCLASRSSWTASSARFGLSGKSFIPMLIASGCGVPAVMATKTIENEKDRRMTIMTTTMIPCGAKMPIIALVFGALAVRRLRLQRGTWPPVFYFLGVIAIILSGIMLKKTKLFAGEVNPVRHGAARVPYAYGEVHPAVHVGACEGLHHQGRYHHLPVHHRHLVPHELRRCGRGLRPARPRCPRLHAAQPHGRPGQPARLDLRPAGL